MAHFIAPSIPAPCTCAADQFTKKDAPEPVKRLIQATLLQLMAEWVKSGNDIQPIEQGTMVAGFLVSLRVETVDPVTLLSPDDQLIFMSSKTVNPTQQAILEVLEKPHTVNELARKLRRDADSFLYKCIRRLRLAGLVRKFDGRWERIVRKV